MRLAQIIFIISLISCGIDNEELECSKNGADRDGVYFAEYELVSGDCPELTPHYVYLDDDESPCISEKKWSENSCRLQSVTTCVNAIDAFIITVESDTTQQDSEGSLVIGEISVVLQDLHENIKCSGTYKASYTRQ